MPGTLRHWTCWDGAAGIYDKQVVLPTPQPLLGGVRLSWWTDMAVPDREGLGLTRHVVRCDRMSVSFIAMPDAPIMSWAMWARTHDVPAEVHRVLENGRMPDRWFVAERSVRVMLDAPRLDALLEERYGRAPGRGHRHEA